MTAEVPQMPDDLRAPFPWFGGKSKVADLVWDRFGYDVVNYIEPFAGSLAVLLSRPGGAGRNETVNDKDCFLANFWRAVQADPEAVAYWAAGPVNEADLHARHRWLVAQEYFQNRILHDPDYYDAKIAGWLVWGISLWIGSGWCVRPDWVGRSGVKMARRGIHRQETPSEHRKRPILKRGGLGVHRAAFAGDVWQQKPNISGSRGASGNGVQAKNVAEDLFGYFEALAARLRRVRVCCGDWTRILSPSATTLIGTTAMFLDPPYDLRVAARTGGDGVAPADHIYSSHDHDLSARVREWAIAHGKDSMFRIALCGYEGEHEMPADWECVEWKTGGGYGNQAKGGNRNAGRERVWFSPHCLSAPLFEMGRVDGK